MFQPNSTTTLEEVINVDDTILNRVQEFTYLLNNSSKKRTDAEIQNMMSKPTIYFGRLRERLWNNHNVSIRVKVKIYLAIILSTLMYGAKTWTVYRRHVKKLHAFMKKHVRSIMKIKWQDKVTNIKDIKHATPFYGRPPHQK